MAAIYYHPTARPIAERMADRRKGEWINKVTSLLVAAVLCAAQGTRAETPESLAASLEAALEQAQETLDKTKAEKSEEGGIEGVVARPLPGGVRIEICCANVLLNFAGTAPPAIPFLPVHCWLAVKEVGTKRVLMTTEAFPKNLEVKLPGKSGTAIKGPLVWPEITERRGGSCVRCNACEHNFTKAERMSVENEADRLYTSEHGGKDIVEMRRTSPYVDADYRRTVERIAKRACENAEAKAYMDRSAKERPFSSETELGVDANFEKRIDNDAWRVFTSEHGGRDVVEMRRVPGNNADVHYELIRERIRKRELDNLRLAALRKRLDSHMDIECLKRATREWKIGNYFLLGPNSNTYAKYVADRCCAKKVNAQGLAPGW